MARWEDALDAQLELCARLGSNEFERDLTISVCEQIYHRNDPDYPDRVGGVLRNVSRTLAMKRQGTVVDTDYKMAAMPDLMAAMAYNADTVYVDPDMMTLWEGLLADFQAEPLLEQDLIAPSGFLWLPRPYVSVDQYGKRVATRAIMWAPMDFKVRGVTERDGKLFVDWGTPGEERAIGFEVDRGQETPMPPNTSDRQINVMLARKDKTDKFHTSGIMFTTWHDTADKDDYSSPADPAGLHLGHMVPWPYRSDWGSTARDPDQIPSTIFAWQALWRLMQQRLAHVAQARPDRHTMRRLRRAKWDERNVTVIRLRRPEPPPGHTPGEGEDVDWTHRWYVRAHWRWQYYASVGMHRQILVAAHVKGPEDRPLLPAKGRVFELVQ